MERQERRPGVLKNKDGLVRSVWLILGAMLLYSIITSAVTLAYISVLRELLINSGDIVVATDTYSPLVDWLKQTALPIINQLINDSIMIAVPVVIWKFAMKHPLGKLGLRRTPGGTWDWAAGMALGLISCSIIFFIVITIGGGHVVSSTPTFSWPTFWWIFTFVLVAFGEEIMNRGFFMAVLRRCRNIYVIMLVPSVIFGLLHLANPGVTFWSVCNIVLVGILFSYMFIKSGNLWMCIGYHFAWNTAQGILYGMPVSGLDIPGIFHTEFTKANVLNGGQFGIEGGVLTTIMILLGFLFVWYYYRNSQYHFMEDTWNSQTGFPGNGDY